MSAMGQYLESQVITHIFRTGNYAKPSVLAIALCTAAPAATDTGALTSKEVSGSGYARQTLNPSDSNWAGSTGGNGTTSNTPAITFPTAGADWGTIVGVAVVDNSTIGSGNLLFYGTLTGNKVVNNGDTFQFASGQLSIQIN